MTAGRWIESASRAETAPNNGGDVRTLGQHTLNLARADEEREAQERALAVRAVCRAGGEHAGELLTMLGLGVS